MAVNPYSPGFGAGPTLLAGRQGALEEVDRAAERVVHGRAAQPLLLTGLRGVGKTSLLHHTRRRLSSEAALGELTGGYYRTPFVVISVEGGPQVDAVLVDRAGRARAALRGDQRWRPREASIGAAGAGVVLRPGEGGGAGPATVHGVLVDLVEEAAERGKRVAVLVDELHEMPTEPMAGLAAATNELAGTDHPVLIVAAQLPVPLAAQGVTYFEDRARRLTVDVLDIDETRLALVAPAADTGMSWATEALEWTVAATGGYPYAIQVYGAALWDAAGEAGRSVIDDRVLAAGRGRASEDMGRLYAGRWDEIPPRSQRYLAAVAHLGGSSTPTPSRAVAEALGGRTSDWSTARAALVDRGAILARDRSVLMALPGWERWVRDNAGQAWSPEDTARVRQVLSDARSRDESWARPRPLVMRRTRPQGL